MAPGAMREGAARQATKETVAELEKRILAQVRNNRPDLLPRLKELRNTDRKEYVKALRDIARQARGAGRGETGGTGPAVQRIGERVRDLAAEFRTAPAERRAQIRRQLEGAVSRLIDARHEQRKAAMVKAIVSRITGEGAGRARGRAGAGGIIPQAQRGRFGPGAGQRFGAGGGAGQVPMERSRQAPGGWYGPGQGRGPAMQQMGPQGRQGPRLGGGTPQTRGWQFQQDPRSSWRR